ncbi:hypothetical protein NOF04DRAFT_1276480 [Fusarium oxysporum II5]|nr:hypothetical protein NOF04DRAFT_1276480 [Fusarium oxysporum II5]
MLSPACPNSTNITIPAPPGFAQAMSRRSFLDLSAQADHDLGPYHEDNPPDHYFLIESLVHSHDQLDHDFAFPGACSASKYESYKNLLQLSVICSYLIVRHLSRHRYFFRKFLFWELLEMHICGQLTAGIYLVQGAVRRTISVSSYPDSTQNNTPHNTLQEPLIQDKKDEKPFFWTRKTRHLQLFVFIVSICSSLRAPKPNNAASYTQKDPKGSPGVLDFSTFIAVSLFSETLVTIFSPTWERLTTRLFRFLSRNFLRRHLSIRGIVVITHLTLLNSFLAIYTAALYVLGGFLAHKMSPASLESMWPLYTTGMMAFNGICEEIVDWRRDLPKITYALGLGCAMCGCVDKRFGYRLGNDKFDMNKLSTQEQATINTALLA